MAVERYSTTCTTLVRLVYKPQPKIRRTCIENLICRIAQHLGSIAIAKVVLIVV